MMGNLKTGVYKVGMSIGLDNWETAKQGLMGRLRSRVGGLLDVGAILGILAASRV